MSRATAGYLFGVDSLSRHDTSYSYAGYRKRFYDFCAEWGYPVVSRGHTANGTWGDTRHSSVSGQTISGAYALLSAQLGSGGSITGAGSVKLLLMCCGAGNVVTGTAEPYVPGVTVPVDLLAFYQMLLDKEPSAVLCIADIPPQNGNQPAVDSFNSEMPAMVAALRAANPSRRIRYWSMNAAIGGPVYNAADFIDDRHPDENASYNLIGDKLVAAIAADVNQVTWDTGDVSAMGSLSTYAKNKLIDHVRNVAAYSPAATHYVHLYAAGSVPISGNGYAAVAVTNNTTTWPNTVGRIKSNGVAFTFPTPSGTWSDVVEARITDSATEGAGNVLASDTFTAVPVSVATGPFSIAVGAFTITAATPVSVGGFADAVVQGLLNRMFGGAAYAQAATVYGSYWAGDPQGAGAQAGSRVAITQATTWAAAASGLAVSSAAVSLTQQATGTYWAEHDASVAGNLLFSAPRSALTGASGTLSAGQLQTTIT